MSYIIKVNFYKVFRNVQECLSQKESSSKDRKRFNEPDKRKRLRRAPVQNDFGKFLKETAKTTEDLGKELKEIAKILRNLKGKQVKKDKQYFKDKNRIQNVLDCTRYSAVMFQNAAMLKIIPNTDSDNELIVSSDVVNKSK